MQTHHSIVRGVAWLVAAGLSALGILVFPTVALVQNEGKPEQPRAVAMASLVLLSPVAVYCFKRGRRFLAKPADELLRQDPRPPVVYLRSFQSDLSTSGLPGEGMLSAQSKAMMYVFSGTEEQQIADVFEQIGPFVAIGRPDERAPLLGAARMYVSHEQWKEKATELIERATLIVFRAGLTPGFWWEVERVCGQVATNRIIFLLPPYVPLHEFRAKLETITGKAMPALPEFGKLGGLLYFGRDGSPRVVEITRKPAFLPPDKELAEALSDTLATVFQPDHPEWIALLSAKLRQRKRNLGLLCLWLVACLLSCLFLPLGENAMVGFIALGVVGFFGGLIVFLRA